MENWIDIKDELPEEFEDVIVTDGSDVWVDNYNLKEGGAIDWTNKFGEEITHWMYMPAPPEEQDEALLFSIVELTKTEQLKVEIAKDLGKATTVRSFLALFGAIASSKELMESFAKASEIFHANKDKIVSIREETKERPLS